MLCAWGCNTIQITSEFFVERCKVSQSKAQEIADALLAGRYLKITEAPRGEIGRQQWFMITKKGVRLANSTALPRMSREKGQSLLKAFLKRVEEINKNPDYVYSVTTVVVYGSYARGESTLGDVEVAFELQPRISDPKECRRLKDQRSRLAIKAGRHFRNTTEVILWPQIEVLLHLKSRVRGLSLHDLSDFIERKKDSNFQYEVLFGDSKAVSAKL